MIGALKVTAWGALVVFTVLILLPSIVLTAQWLIEPMLSGESWRFIGYAIMTLLVSFIVGCMTYPWFPKQ